MMRARTRRTRAVRGSGKILLLAALVVSGMALAIAAVVLLGNDERPSLLEDLDGDEEAQPLVPDPDRDRRRTSERDSGEESPEDGIDGGFLTDDGDPRTPFGGVMPPNKDRLKKAIEIWKTEIARSEEMRRMIDVLQRDGGVVPAELVEEIVAMLDVPEFRIDAVLALGMLNDDTSGARLAEIAIDPAADAGVREAALKALSESGQSAAGPQILALLESEGLDRKLERAGIRALGAIGGVEASTKLAQLLVDHHADDDLSSVIITAAATAKDSGTALAEVARNARGEGNHELGRALMSIALRQGENVSTELRQEVLLAAEDPTVYGDMDDEARARLRAGAITAAAGMGEVDLVLRMIENDTDGLGGVALHALRRCRGDDAAEKIGTFLDNTTDAQKRVDLVFALSETGSRKATDQLVKALGSENANERQAAARGFQTLKDPAAVPALLKRLDAEGEEYAIRLAAVKALSVIGHKDALPKLRELSDSKDPVRLFAKHAIKQIERGGAAEAQRRR